MTRDWPGVLRRYVGPTPNTLTLRPERWASGQLLLVIMGTILFVIFAIGVIASDQRWASLAMTCFGTAMAGIPGRDRFRWVRVESTGDGVTVTDGLWRWKSRSQHLTNAEVQSVRIQDDFKNYAYHIAIPILRHVVIQRGALLAAGESPEVRIAEMFGLETVVLEALRDELATRAETSAVAAKP